MILTEDKIYTMSLETESVNRDSGLTNNTIELEFTNKELLHAIVTCGMPVHLHFRRRNVLDSYTNFFL